MHLVWRKILASDLHCGENSYGEKSYGEMYCGEIAGYLLHLSPKFSVTVKFTITGTEFGNCTFATRSF